MMENRMNRKQVPILRRRLMVKSEVKYYEPIQKRDLRSLTFDDFKPPIALKSEFPKIEKKSRQFHITSMKKHQKVFNDLHVTGKYACIMFRYSPALQNNIGLDTNDIYPVQNSTMFL